MAGFTRNRTAFAHRGKEASGRVGQGAVRATGRPEIRGGSVSGLGRDGAGVERPALASGIKAWTGTSRAKLGVALVAGLLLAALWGSVHLWRVPGPSATGGVLVVWHMPGEEQSRIASVDRQQWLNFVASQRAARLKSREEILAKTRAEMMVAVAPLFDDMTGRLKDYANWFYFFPTTYRMAFTAVIAALSRDAGDSRGAEQVATDAINGLLRDRFIEVVVVPERFGPAVDEKAREVLQHAIANELAAAESLNRSLAAFLNEYGRSAGGDHSAAAEPLPVVLSWEALGMPANAASMSAPPDAVQLIKHDPALSDIQSSAGAEGMMLVARQVARRMVQIGVNSATTALVMPMVAGGALGPADVLVSPVLGIAAFSMGIGAEFGTIKARQAVEGPHFNEVSASVLEQLREHESHGLADAVAKRVDTWLGG